MNSALLDYPEFFREKLRANAAIRAGVESSLTALAELLQVSKLPFFPDYTDHGTQHLTAVLAIAEKLIADRARSLFTGEDAAVLILSVVFHDLALHLSEAGFVSLLNFTSGSANSKPDEWRELWREFLSTAKRWDDHKLVELFGSDKAGAPRALVRDPFDHYDNLTESDRKLIGEFIRQHHAKLGHQFALSGFPGLNGQLIQFDSVDRTLRGLAGIVARSHGFSLRDSIKSLEDGQFNKLEQENVHPVFLMGVLRVADFLDLGTDRAPVIAFAYKEFKSPISQSEWRTNQAFRKMSWGNPDPESVHIPAVPTDVYSFLELKRWLSGIQSELDMTWAVFGEVFGAHPRFSQFGLAIRRIRSNIIDDPEGFARKASFVPRRVELGVAGVDVLKLFIHPLYGEHSEIGIRELIQNAVDAVRERWEFAKNHPHLSSSTPVHSEADVVVWLDDPDEHGVALLTVSDNGIGMTDEIVADYFLKAGASFRRSIAWKKEFELESNAAQRSQLKSRVLRSGRFGIGVLAAFLLGDEIEVSTRHVTTERGIRFSMRLDLSSPAVEMAPIQLNYDATLPIGTTIKIKVTKVKRAISQGKGRREVVLGSDIFTDPSLWDWYCLESPSVVRLQGRAKKRLKQSVTVPAEEEVPPPSWHRVPSSDYRTVHVLTSGTTKAYAPNLVCNGIKLRETVGFFTSLIRQWPVSLARDVFPGQGVFRLRPPALSVFDPDGNLPLNLQRSGLVSLELDFLPDAFAAQAREVLAMFLLLAPEEPTFPAEFWSPLSGVLDFGQTIPVFFTKTGSVLLTAPNLRGANVKNCLLVDIESLTRGWWKQLRGKYDALLVARQDVHGASSMYSLNDLNPWIASIRMISRSDEIPTVKRPFKFRKDFSAEGLQVYRTGNCPASLLTAEEVGMIKTNIESSVAPNTDNFVAAELFLKSEALSNEQPALSISRYWEQIIRNPEIPFDRVERQTTLKHAYEALNEYLRDFSDARPTALIDEHRSSLI